MLKSQYGARHYCAINSLACFSKWLLLKERCIASSDQAIFQQAGCDLVVLQLKIVIRNKGQASASNVIGFPVGSVGLNIWSQGWVKPFGQLVGGIFLCVRQHSYRPLNSTGTRTNPLSPRVSIRYGDPDAPARCEVLSVFTGEPHKSRKLALHSSWTCSLACIVRWEWPASWWNTKWILRWVPPGPKPIHLLVIFLPFYPYLFLPRCELRICEEKKSLCGSNHQEDATI